MARTPSAVLKNGKSSKAVKAAEKVKELKAELKTLNKELAANEKAFDKLITQRQKLEEKLQKLEGPVETVVVGDGAGEVVTPVTAE